jgi:hypothetical protein
VAVNIGTSGLQRCYVGDQEVQRIYVGGKYAWPSLPTAKVEWLGSTVASGATNTFPAHQPGDLLVVVAVETGAASRPSLAAGFTEVHANTSGMSICIGYRIATASDTPVGTWSNAFYNTAYAFRNANTNTPFGGITSMIDTKAISPTITMQDTSGDSALCYGFSNNGTSGSWGATPAGFISKNGVARMANLQKIDSTSDGELRWSSTAGTVNFRNWVFEVLPDTGEVVEEPWLYGIEQVNKPGRVVDFTAKKGFVDTTGDEAFMFRCSTISGLDGYVARNFTKTFPSGTAYTKFDCTLQDLYGDGIPANNGEMLKTISFQVTPTA